jgi:hypothetical protein
MANLIKNTLIAGILIQSSWFLTAVAVDISTIATYGIGGLPLSVVGKATNESGTVLPNTTVFVPVDDGTASPALFLGTKSYTGDNGKRNTGRQISPCATVEYTNGAKEELIIGREYINYGSKDKVLTKTNEKICHYWGSIYRFGGDLMSGQTFDATTQTGQTDYN